jgi:ABC-2 type transport system ATP-binding protein
MNNDILIDTTGLSLQYQGKLALDSLDLQIRRGGIHALVGANGAGKSSLFRLLLGFETPTSGSARLLGCDSRSLTPAIRARVGFVNDEHTLPPWMKVAELAAMQRGLYPQWNEERYVNVLGNFNVAPSQSIRQLSRGERAGVSLAMALAQSPELLILDEPTLGLDVVAKRKILASLTASSFDGDATVVYCSHQMDEIERLADHMIVMERGKLLADATPSVLCERVTLWVAELPTSTQYSVDLPGVLQIERIDGLTHLLVIDQDATFGEQLRQLGAISIQSMPVSLERAVTGILARGHISNSAPVRAAA